jgi:hypothetical protein
VKRRPSRNYPSATSGSTCPARRQYSSATIGRW